MTSYEMGYLQIISGPIQAMGRNPAMYLGGLEAPKGEFLAARLISDLVWLRALPAEVIEIDGWWVVRSSVDWLASGSPAYTTDNAFSRIVSWPEMGANSFHGEILLAAFADAVVTSGTDGIKWVNGTPDKFVPPVGVNLSGPGRVIAFTLARDPTERDRECFLVLPE
jgi:hypothetical protein